jgi:hypothetical protein
LLRAVKVQDMERNKHEHMKRERNAGEASIIGNKKRNWRWKGERAG